MFLKSLNRSWLAMIASAMLLLSPAAFAAERINTLEKSGLLSGFEPSGTAIRGYDPVAYWTESKPVEGSEQFETEWQGANWRFSSQENLDLFLGDPERYAPQYGGYCAYGVAKDALVKIEPENWSIVDNKLYLNFSDGVQSKWDADVPGFIADADAKFEALLKSQ